MRSHGALRRGRRGADWLAFRTIRLPGVPRSRPAGRNAGGDRTASGGHRRPGGDGQESQTAGPVPRPPVWRRRPSLKDWRVRSRLLLLIAVPVLVAVAFGGLAAISSLRTAQSYQQVQRLAVLAGDASGLAQALQNEREDTVTFIAMGNQGGRQAALSASPAQKAAAAPQLALLRADDSTTDRAAADVTSVAASIGGSYPAPAQTQAQGAITAIDDLPSLRQAATGSKLPVLTVINDYGAVITQLLTLENEVAAGSKDAALADNVQVASLVSNMQEEASQQQAIVTSALRPEESAGLVGVTQLSAEALSVLNQQAAEQAANLSAFNLAATAAQRQLYNSAVSSPLAATAQQQLQQASTLLASGATSPSDPTLAVAANDASYITSSLGSVGRQLMSSIIAQSGSLRAGATTTAVIEGVGILLLLVLALVLIAVVGRSMIGPLRRLRARALEIAGERLPETVRLMAETDGEGVSLDVEPIDVDSADEIGEVARAFDQVHREALRLAANEAALRGNVNAMFVNLSRRSQSLVERQIRLISHLEQGEQDSKRLASLFQMDHLATRMRRNSENLLVLAGQDLSRRWNRPVALVDVLRAALSEIERYERVTLNVQPGIAVRAQAVSDVIHLTAELVENATSFSAADSLVTISGHLLSSGGVLLEITDQGVGIDAEEMAHANWRLDNPPVVDVAVSRRMGLFVVGRLAARHGIRVRLRPADTGGVVALVWLPDETITREIPGGPLVPRRSQPEPEHSLPGLAVAGTAADAGERGQASAVQEAAAARTPRFAPLRASEDTVTSGPQDTVSSGPQDTVTSGPQPAAAAPLRPASAWAPTGPLAAFRDPPAARPEAGAAGPQGQGGQLLSSGGRSPSGVIVPPAVDTEEQNRLPIFEAVESDWFRRVRRVVDRAGQGQEAGSGWSSPADEGWRAAEAVHAPSSGGTTTAGLPKRVPKANLVPGAVGAAAAGEPAPAAVPARSAAATRDRFASYQRGVLRGRADAGGAGSGGGEDEAAR
jgi:signal transduction histidine kinase